MTPTAGRCPRRCRRTPRPAAPRSPPIDTTGYDGDGNVTSASDGIGNTTTYGYDQLGDQVTATAPDNSVTTTAYDADRQPLSVTGPTGAQTQTTWDYLGRKATSTQIERDTGSGTAAYTTELHLRRQQHRRRVPVPGHKPGRGDRQVRL